MNDEFQINDSPKLLFGFLVSCTSYLLYLNVFVIKYLIFIVAYSGWVGIDSVVKYLGWDDASISPDPRCDVGSNSTVTLASCYVACPRRGSNSAVAQL